MSISYKFKILDKADSNFIVLKNDNDNCAIGLNYQEKSDISFRANNKEQLTGLNAIHIGTGTVVTWGIVQNIKKADCYRINARIFGLEKQTDVIMEPFKTAVPTLYFPANIFENIELNYSAMEATLTVDTGYLESLMDEVTEKTNSFIKNDNWSRLFGC